MSKTRAGFNLSDFSDDEERHQRTYSDHNSFHIHIDQQTQPTQPIQNPGQRRFIYQILESKVVTTVLFAILIIDFVLFFIFFLQLLQKNPLSFHIPTVYTISDYTTAVVFFFEVNARLYAYGLSFYIRSPLRDTEYAIATINAFFILSTLFSTSDWLLIARLIRQFRISTSFLTYRERHLKWHARQELENVALVLQQDQGNRKGLTNWTISSNDIATGERAGHGAFGTVFSGLFRGTLVAVKQIPASEREETMETIEEEAITLVNLRHPNVVLFMGFVCEPSRLWIVTEYCSRRSLRDVLDGQPVPLSEGRILKLALGAARGLAYLHGQNPPVLHLDLKTSNILISSGWEAKLGDFGLSRNITNIEKDCFAGTMQYTAPEILEANQFSTAADIYSFGVCLWEMATGDVPFKDMSHIDLLWSVVKSGLRPPIDALNVKLPGLVSESHADHGPCTEERVFLNSIENRKTDFITQALRCTRSDDNDFVTSSAPLIHGQCPEQKHIRSIQKEELHCSLPKNPKDISSSFPQMRNADETKPRGPTDGPLNASYECGQLRLNTYQPGGETAWETMREGSEKLEKPTPSHLKVQAQSGQLADLTHRVTAKLDKFDDRPPFVRHRDDQASSRAGSLLLQIDEPKSSPLPKLSLAWKQKLRNIVQVKTASDFHANGEKGRQEHCIVDLAPAPLRDESEAFSRRLATFSIAQGEPTSREGTAIAEKQSMEFTSEKADNITQRRGALVSRQYLRLIEKCWAQDPKERPSASEIVWMLMLLINGEI